MTPVRQQPRNAEPATAAVVRRRRLWTVVAIGEAVAAAAVVTWDLLIPSLVLLAMAAVSLRLRYRTVWASVLAHGFNNTLGFLTFFVVGPVYGLW